jgi:hypothetical protein
VPALLLIKTPARLLFRFGTPCRLAAMLTCSLAIRFNQAATQLIQVASHARKRGAHRHKVCD